MWHGGPMRTHADPCNDVPGDANVVGAGAWHGQPIWRPTANPALLADGWWLGAPHQVCVYSQDLTGRARTRGSDSATQPHVKGMPTHRTPEGG